MPGDTSSSPKSSGIEVAPGIFLPRSALRFFYSRSSGPGGQHVNKVSTKAQLHLELRKLEPFLGIAAISRLIKLAGPSHITKSGVLALVSDATRSQRANRQTCLDRLRELIVQAKKRPRVRRKTKPTKAAKDKRLDVKRKRSHIKQGRQRLDDDT